VVVTTLLGWAFAVFSQFAALIALSAIARLLYYAATCLALPVFRRTMPDAERRFAVPGGAAIPIAAASMSAWLLLGSTKAQVALTAAVLLVGAAVFGCYRLSTVLAQRRAILSR
jgi:amino acid transporter